MIKLVLSDMDNTLIPYGAHHVTARTIEAVHAVLDAGVPFGPATGREPIELRRFFQGDEDCFLTGIFSNGKRVRANGTYVRTVLFDHDVLVRIDEALRGEKGMFLVCYPNKTNESNPAYGVHTTARELAVFEARTHFTGTVVDEVPNEEFIAATIACPGAPERMDRCRQIIAEAVPEVRIVSPISEWFDVLPQGVSKASGLDDLLGALGISPEEVVFFGDAENDLDIMRKVPHATAVANATEEVKRLARHHVGPVGEDGVAEALFEIARATHSGEEPAFLRDES